MKLPDDVVNRCVDECLQDVIVRIPRNKKADVGLDELHDLIANEIKRSKKLWYLSEDDIKLFLDFPDSKAMSIKLDEFFDSPRNYRKNRRFEGVLAIDISSYEKNRFEHENIDRLLDFINREEDIVFLLIVRTDCRNSITRLEEKLSSEVLTDRKFETIDLGYPTQEMLVTYTKHRLDEMKLDHDEDFLKQFFRDGMDFSLADKVIELVRSENGKSHDYIDLDQFENLMRRHSYCQNHVRMGY